MSDMILEDLVELVKQGDENAFQELYQRFYKKIYYAALKITKNQADAKDISQETFLHGSIPCKCKPIYSRLFAFSSSPPPLCLLPHPQGYFPFAYVPALPQAVSRFIFIPHSVLCSELHIIWLKTGSIFTPASLSHILLGLCPPKAQILPPGETSLGFL